MVPRGRAVGQPVRFANHSIIAISATVLVLYSYSRCNIEHTIIFKSKYVIYFLLVPYSVYMYRPCSRRCSGCVSASLRSQNFSNWPTGVHWKAHVTRLVNDSFTRGSS